MDGRDELAAQFMCAMLQNPAIVAGERQISDVDYLEKLALKSREAAAAFIVASGKAVWSGDPEAEIDEDGEEFGLDDEIADDGEDEVIDSGASSDVDTVSVDNVFPSR